METNAWQIPLLLTPIVGLLLISTSSRHAQIHSEIHHLLDEELALPRELVLRLRKRVWLFRNALVALYASAAIFAIGSILGVLAAILGSGADWIIIAFSCAGILSFLVAAIQLVRESYLSLEIFDAHIHQIITREQQSNP